MASLPAIVTHRVAWAAPLPPRDLIREGRTRHHQPCPICHRDDGQCIALPLDGCLQVWCIRGEGAPGGVRLTWGFRGQIWYFALVASGSMLPRSLFPHPRECPLAEPGEMHRLLSRVVRSFGLSAEHQTLLATRGYDVADCGPDGRHIFASLPADVAARIAVANRLLSDAYTRTTETDLLGVYGFERLGRSPCADVAFLPRVRGTALLEFARDAQGRLIGFQYAPDTPALDNKGKPKKRLSPTRFATGGRAHVARPTADTGTACWHTEAIHKANLTADRVGAVALGSFGVGNTVGLVAGARSVDPHRKRLHVLALDADHHGSPQEVALARRLQEQGYRVALARWDGALGNGPDDALVAGAAVTLLPATERRPARQDRRVLHAYNWQRRQETPEARQALLRAEAERLAARVEAHLTSADPAERGTLLVVAAPPGVGKSSTIAALGVPTTARPLGEHNLAWVAERRDMTQSIPALAAYRQIEPCTARNCSAADLHALVAASGHNTWGIHRQHPILCDYATQFRAQGSAIYQLAHVPTGYPAQHDGIVIDECNPSAWLPELAITAGKLQAAIAAVAPGSVADGLLRATLALLLDAAQAKTPLHGQALFAALDARCSGQLDAWVTTLTADPAATDTHPWPEGVDIDAPDAAQVAADLPPVLLPHLVHALAAELPRYRAGGSWNSCLRLGPSAQHEMALYLTQPRRFGQPPRGILPPRVLLDATADEELLVRLFDAPVAMARAAVDPPPGMRHLAVRTGKRYGKTSLTARHGRDLARAIAECRYLLRELDPDGTERAAGRVGLVTHKDCEAAMAQALGIAPERAGHFWGLRGSNRLEACTLLLLVGTPAVRPEQVARMARAYYRDDPEPLDETAAPDAQGRWRYQDTRLQRVADALVQAELSQCAHRNRPLRYDGRVVVTLCASDILDLPATTIITSLPLLAADGTPLAEARQADAEARLMAAAAALEERGDAVTARALATAAHISLNTACAWLRQRRTIASISEAMLSATQDSSSSAVDNISPSIAPPEEAADPEAPALAAVDGQLSLPPTATQPSQPGASAVPAWHCEGCGTTSPVVDACALASGGPR